MLNSMIDLLFGEPVITTTHTRTREIEFKISTVLNELDSFDRLTEVEKQIKNLEQEKQELEKILYK